MIIHADCVSRYLRWCAEHDNRPMSRACLNQWVADMLDAGAAPGTARIRQQAIRRFAAWRTAGGELPVDPFPGMKAPRVQPPLVGPLTDAELRALLGTCTVPQESAPVGELLHHRRDEAIIRLMLETAIRSGELIGLSLDDLDLIGRLVTIRRGKGGPGRTIPNRAERRDHRAKLAEATGDLDRMGAEGPFTAADMCSECATPMAHHGWVWPPSSPLSRVARLGRQDARSTTDPRDVHEEPRHGETATGGTQPAAARHRALRTAHR